MAAAPEAPAPTPDEATSTEVSASEGATSHEAAIPEESAVVAASPGKQGRRKRKRRREIRPPERRCQTCIDFLKDRKTIELPCKQCGTPIYWPPESQLQTHLGAWAEPAMCGACKRDVTEAARAAEREALRHPGGVAPTEAPALPQVETPGPAEQNAAEPPADLTN